MGQFIERIKINPKEQESRSRLLTGDIHGRAFSSLEGFHTLDWLTIQLEQWSSTRDTFLFPGTFLVVNWGGLLALIG